MSERIEFSEPTKRVVAARAGYRYSLPTCGKVTIGPDLPADKFVQTGVAAHIFSAAQGGPRGQGGLTEEQLCSAKNAIWLCATHGRLVDANWGNSYPPALLQNYKALQEAKAAREYQGLHFPVHWFEELTLHRSPLFEDETKLRFGKLTLVIGPNFSGKSALGDWLAGFGKQAQLWRWLPQPRNKQDLDFTIRYQKPEAQALRMSLRSTGEIEFEVDGKRTPVQPVPLRFLFLKEERFLEKSASEMDDVELICNSLTVDPLELPTLVQSVGPNGLGYAKNLRLLEENEADEGDEPKFRRRLYADVITTKPGLTFGVLSHTEQALVLLELAVVAARLYAQYAPTMLILDRGMHNFMRELLAEVSEKLSAAQESFQTLIVIPNEPQNLAELGWAGWTIVHLQFHEPHGKTTIAQEPF